ncbi:MAG: membrane protein insertion efficiency factor YidD [Mariprofundaceae bacterium]
MKRFFLLPVRLYRYVISPFLPSRCIYMPTCSAYMIEAVETHGTMRGGLLGVKRLCRCHPWAKGSYDPVPENIQGSKK